MDVDLLNQETDPSVKEQDLGREADEELDLEKEMEEDLVQEIEGRGLEGEINADPDQMKGDDVPHT